MDQASNSTRTSASAADATVVRPMDAPATRGSAAAKEVRVAFLVKRHGLDAAPLTWASDSPVVLMLADLLAASGAAPAGESSEFLDATAPDALGSLILASRAHRLAEAYAAHPGADLQSLSIAILPVVMPKKDAAREMGARAALTQARPGQILVLPEIQKAVEFTPALQFRRVIVPGSNLELLELISASGRRVTAEHAALTTVSPTVTQASTASMPTPGAVRAVQPVAQPALKHREERAAAGKGANRMPMIYGAVAAAVVVAVIGFVALKPKAHEAVTAPAAVAPVVTAPASVAQPKQPAKAPEAILTRKAADAKPAAARDEKHKEAAQAVQAALPVAPSSTPRESSGGGGFSSDQISAILDGADSNAANAKYDKAIQSYNFVLGIEPGNARARSGKARALQNKELQ